MCGGTEKRAVSQLGNMAYLGEGGQENSSEGTGRRETHRERNRQLGRGNGVGKGWRQDSECISREKTVLLLKWRVSVEIRERRLVSGQRGHSRHPRSCSQLDMSQATGR
jgi:hypothetical protein